MISYRENMIKNKMIILINNLIINNNNRNNFRKRKINNKIHKIPEMKDKSNNILTKIDV